MNYYYDTRNLIWLVIRNLPILYGLKVLIFGLIAMLIYSVRDGYLKYWFKGFIDGIKNIKDISIERNIMNKATMKKIHIINNKRPSLSFYIKNRLLKKTCRL